MLSRNPKDSISSSTLTGECLKDTSAINVLVKKFLGETSHGLEALYSPIYSEFKEISPIKHPSNENSPVENVPKGSFTGVYKQSEVKKSSNRKECLRLGDIVDNCLNNNTLFEIMPQDYCSSSSVEAYNNREEPQHLQFKHSETLTNCIITGDPQTETLNGQNNCNNIKSFDEKLLKKNWNTAFVSTLPQIAEKFTLKEQNTPAKEKENSCDTDFARKQYNTVPAPTPEADNPISKIKYKDSSLSSSPQKKCRRKSSNPMPCLRALINKPPQKKGVLGKLEVKYFCHICGKGYKLEPFFQAHLLKHKSIAEKVANKYRMLENRLDSIRDENKTNKQHGNIEKLHNSSSGTACMNSDQVIGNQQNLRLAPMNMIDHNPLHHTPPDQFASQNYDEFSSMYNYSGGLPHRHDIPIGMQVAYNKNFFTYDPVWQMESDNKIPEPAAFLCQSEDASHKCNHDFHVTELGAPLLHDHSSWPECHIQERPRYHLNLDERLVDGDCCYSDMHVIPQPSPYHSWHLAPNPVSGEHCTDKPGSSDNLGSDTASDYSNSFSTKNESQELSSECKIDTFCPHNRDTAGKHHSPDKFSKSSVELKEGSCDNKINSGKTERNWIEILLDIDEEQDDILGNYKTNKSEDTMYHKSTLKSEKFCINSFTENDTISCSDNALPVKQSLKTDDELDISVNTDVDYKFEVTTISSDESTESIRIDLTENESMLNTQSDKEKAWEQFTFTDDHQAMKLYYEK